MSGFDWSRFDRFPALPNTGPLVRDVVPPDPPKQTEDDNPDTEALSPGTLLWCAEQLTPSPFELAPHPPMPALPDLSAVLSASGSPAAAAPGLPAAVSRRCRHWCWTLNNPTPDECAHIGCLCVESPPGYCRYLVMGHEVGEAGTPHLQGYLELVKQVRMTWLQEHVNDRAHYEGRRASREAARDYCKKDGEWLEFGEWKEEERGRRRDVEIMVEA
ncbi:unnamed protein product, partial [marine sediment metagenome]